MSENKDKHLFIETILDNWEDIFKLNQFYLEKFIYRGQANRNWDLSSSLERLINNLYLNLIDKYVYAIEEKEMIKDFQWKYHLYSNKIPDEKDLIEWIVIMQHYGSATRLLDFSKSIFVALYMAIYNSSNDAALWAINKIPINNKTFDEYRARNNVNSVGQDLLDLFSLELAQESINKRFDRDIHKQVFLVNPKISNERLALQQGLFLMQSDIKCTFFDCLLPYINNQEALTVDFNELVKYSHEAKYKQEDITIVKIIIPRENHYKITKQLRAMNITAETLFPGLEGLAKSMNFGRSGLGQKK